jgi:hypothetical protein
MLPPAGLGQVRPAVSPGHERQAIARAFPAERDDRIARRCASSRFGNTLASLAKWETGGCPVNNALPGGTFGEIDPLTGDPYIACPKDDAACTARTLNAARWSGAVDLNATAVPTDSHPGNFSYSHGNETSRNKPLTAFFAGNKYYRGGDASCMYAKELNTNHPDQGFIRMKWLLGQKCRRSRASRSAGVSSVSSTSTFASASVDSRRRVSRNDREFHDVLDRLCAHRTP